VTTVDLTAGPVTGAPPHAVAQAVRLRDVRKVFGHGRHAVTALDGVSLDVHAGEFVCLVGASGCGKSTVLHLVAGLDRPTSGTVDVVGRTALMFQEGALFPWLTVRANVELPLKLAKVGKRERRERADDLLHLVRLEAFADKRPHELSGGMRQRVALARSLAQDADVLGMDEPFGALDAMTRDILHEELERILRGTGTTTLFVTHDVREAARLADRIVLLTSRPGRVATVIDVDLPHGRHQEDPAVANLAASVTELLREEVARHGRTPAR
jgi:NitT/TauT family transport system ATP-binding protein